MIIGLVLLGIVAVLLFFGVAERVFKSFGIAYWLAFVMVGLLIGCAFIPSFSIGSVKINVAGFIAPVVFASVFYFLAVRAGEGWHAIVATSTVAALYIATELLIGPIADGTVTALVSGFLCGASTYLVGKSKIAALAAVFAGFPIGEIGAALVSAYAYGDAMRLGTAAAFDACVLAAVTAVALFETIAAIKRTVAARARRARGEAEAANEFDADEYKRYFDE